MFQYLMRKLSLENLISYVSLLNTETQFILNVYMRQTTKIYEFKNLKFKQNYRGS
jgi:hypothetical protein